MPKILNPKIHDTCFYCGCQAHYISVNSKQLRCKEKIQQCPGVIEKAKQSRHKDLSAKELSERMKKMSIKGNQSLAKLHNDDTWVKNKGNKISHSLKERGGHSGKNNPMYGKKHTAHTIDKLKERANSRNPECYEKGTSTKIDRGLAVPKDQKSEWELYREKVTNYTRLSWLNYQSIINPQGLERGDEYELDHKYSITEGFNNGVPPEIIGHHCNLEIITKEENRSKRTKCSIALDDLLKSAK